MMIFVEVKYYWDEHLCINAGWDTEDIYFLFQAATAFYDCYKDILLAYCDYSNWSGKDALYIDDCS